MTDLQIPDLHPVQRHWQPNEPAVVRKEVALAAYEVYCAVYGEQEAMITGWCRGGFSAGELIAFLYARGFPRNEWRERVLEALNGMRGL